MKISSKERPGLFDRERSASDKNAPPLMETNIV